MPTLETSPPRDAHPDAISTVHALISRPAPWPPEAIRKAAAAIQELISRWECFQRSHPDGGAVEPSPHLAGVAEALEAMLATLPTEEGR